MRFDTLADNVWRELAVAVASLIVPVSVFVLGPETPEGVQPWLFTIGATATFVLGVLLIERGFTAYQRYALFRDTPTTTVRGAAMGPVEIGGTVAAIDTFQAPISGEECVAYLYEVREYDESARYAKWQVIDAGCRSTPFRLRDETGSIVVDPEDADLDLEPTANLMVYDGELPPRPVQRFAEEELEEVSLEQPDLAGTADTDRKFIEYAVRPGDDIYVFGTATRSDGQVAVTAGTHAPFIISTGSRKEEIGGMGRKILQRLGGGAVLIIASLAAIMSVVGLLL